MPPEAHYAGTYWKRSKVIRQRAIADPSTRCWRCGLTLEEVRRITRKRVTWHAGHVIDGDPFSPLRAEHSSCNESAGRKRATKRRDLNSSRRWY